MSELSITIIFGTSAVSGYQDNDPDYLEDGAEETFKFNTEAEVDAFLQGIEAMDGWMAYCVKNGDITPEEEDE
jgi:hypothetical protein